MSLHPEFIGKQPEQFHYVGEKREQIPDIEGLFSSIITHPKVNEIIQRTGSQCKVNFDGYSWQLTISSPDLIWFMYKLRDRAHDGPGWKPQPLTDWLYDKEVDRISIPALEESTYWLDPRYPLSDEFSPELCRFIVNPFLELEQSTQTSEILKWYDNWQNIMRLESPPYPGFFTNKNIPGLRSYILNESRKILTLGGYVQLTAVPTWFHTCNLYEWLGFQYSCIEDRENINRLKHALLTYNGEPLSKLSWRVMAQFWYQKVESMGITHGSDNNALRDEEGTLVVYPLKPERNIWMYLDL